jgi:hypothetical protein
MKLEKWALIAEIVGGAAVLLTVIFVLIELRANSALLERQIALERDNRDMQTVLESETLLRLISRIDEVDGTVSPAKTAIMERYDFDPVDAEHVLRYYRRQWAGYEVDFEAGATDELRRRLSLMLRFPDQRLYWEFEGQNPPDSDFARFVNEEVFPTVERRPE